MPDADSRPRPFRLLSLDGGGILGAFAAAFLADVERRLGCRIADHFDLIAGTSTGGIIAAALAAGEPADRVVRFYSEWGPRIFRRQKFGPWGELLAWFPNLFLRRKGLDVQSLFMPNYSPVELAAALREVFGEKTIGELTRTRILLTSVDLVQGKTVVFKTPHLPNLIRDRHYRIADAVLASTAAPTFFPPAQIAGKGAYADGGVWANNPAMVAVVEAIKIGEACVRPCDPRVSLDRVACLSIGTGRGQYIANPGRTPPGVAWWLGGQKIFTVLMTSQAQGVDFQTKYVLGDRYHRVDFDVKDPSWKLDSVNVIDDLIHLGEARAAEAASGLQEAFFATTTVPYHPY